MSLPSDNKFRSPDQIREIRDLVWNIILGTMLIVMFIFSSVVWYVFLTGDEKASFDIVVRMFTISVGLPIYFALAAAQKIPSEISGAVIMTLIGFALGKLL